MADRNDLLSILPEAGDEDSRELSGRQIYDQVIAISFAAIETTVITLTFTLY